jgi:hypothetical protein
MCLHLSWSFGVPFPVVYGTLPKYRKPEAKECNWKKITALFVCGAWRENHGIEPGSPRFGYRVYRWSVYFSPSVMSLRLLFFFTASLRNVNFRPVRALMCIRNPPDCANDFEQEAQQWGSSLNSEMFQQFIYFSSVWGMLIWPLWTLMCLRNPPTCQTNSNIRHSNEIFL